MAIFSKYAKYFIKNARKNQFCEKVRLGTTAKLLVPKFIKLLWEYFCLCKRAYQYIRLVFADLCRFLFTK